MLHPGKRVDGQALVVKEIAGAFADAFKNLDTAKSQTIPKRAVDFLERLGVPPSPVVAAILDALQCIPVTTIDDAQSIETFGCKLDGLPKVARRILVVRAGGRGGKTSRILAPLAIFFALTTPLTTLRKGEHAWSLLVAPDMTLALQTLNFVRGYFEESEFLRSMVTNGKRRSKADEEQQVGTATCITIRRPDGKLVDIRIGVASGGGKWGRGKTLCFAGFDEAAFFPSEEDKVVNDRELYRAVIQRVVPGGIVAMVSTPWIEGYGVFEELFADWGDHREALCAQGPTRALNPTWDPDHTIENHLRKTDPDNAAREIDAIPLPAGTKLFLPPDAILMAIASKRDGNIEPDGSRHYGGCDLGFRRNSSALALSCWNEATSKVTVSYVEEIKPKRGHTLKPSEVAAGFAKKAIEYRAGSVMADMHGVDAAAEEFGKHSHPNTGDSVSYVGWSSQPDEQFDKYVEFRRLMTEGLLDLPDVPSLTGAMRRVTVRPGPGGSMKIELPRMGSAHGDLLQATVLSVVQVPLPSRSEANSVAFIPRKENPLAGGGF